MNNPLAVITGASDGIGKELARVAARDGYDVVVVARRRDRLAALAGELSHVNGINARVVVADLAVSPGVDEVVAAVDGAPVDVLVNAAGFGGVGRFALERSLDTDLAMINVNVSALVRLTGLLLPRMLDRGRGAVLNVASTAAFSPGPHQAVYFATKAFVKSFSEALTEECRGTGVRVTALCPGPVDTGFAAVAGLEGTPLMSTQLIKVPVEVVAKAGWDGLHAGRAVVIPGLPLRIAMQALRLTPRRLAAHIAEQSVA